MSQDGCGGGDGVIAVQDNDEIALSPPQIQPKSFRTPPLNLRTLPTLSN